MTARETFDARVRPRAGALLHRLGDLCLGDPVHRQNVAPISHDPSVPLPPGAIDYLVPDNPRLVELRSAYAHAGTPMSDDSSFYWNDRRVARYVELPWFRGDNAYVWQQRQLGPEVRLKRYLALQELKAQDALGLLDILDEDGLFGCYVERYENHKPISRDLLDSVSEINFLDRHVGLAGRRELRVLDIGAGYGRLAHRMSRALPNLVRYDCVDGVAESTFLCEYYLGFRGVTPPARAVALHEIETQLSDDGYDLVVNTHSFSECTYEVIDWWMRLVRSLDIPWLFIVPNHRELLSTETDFSFRDFLPLITDAGYELEVTEPMHSDPDIRELVGVHDQYFLFRRTRRT